MAGYNDSTLRLDPLAKEALLAGGHLDTLDFEDVLTGDDTQIDPVLVRHMDALSLFATREQAVQRVRRLVRDYHCKFDAMLSVNSSTYVTTGREISGKVIAQPVSHADVIQKIVRELGRLTDGWAGPDSVAPSSKVLRDIQQVASSLPAFSRTPDAEVDPDDGSVVLRWIADDASRSFSLTFLGHGNVTGFYSSDDTTDAAWKLRASDSIRLAIKFSSEHISSLLNS